MVIKKNVSFLNFAFCSKTTVPDHTARFNGPYFKSSGIEINFQPQLGYQQALIPFIHFGNS